MVTIYKSYLVFMRTVSLYIPDPILKLTKGTTVPVVSI